MGELTRSGFIALAGRPNVGKSTLANAVVGAKVTIVSDKPQTTRRAVRAVATGPDWQLVLIDLPGFQRPRDALTERMQRRVERELEDADGCLFVLNAQEGLGPGDRFIARLLQNAPVPVIIALNKVDRAARATLPATLQAAADLELAREGLGPGDRFIARLLQNAPVPVIIALNKVDRAARATLPATLQAAADLELAREILPVSARTGAGVSELTEHLIALLSPGPFYFGAEERSDQPESVVLAELVREQVLRRTREEIPHAVEVEIEAIEAAREDLVRIQALLLVETDSQKRIVVGAGGRMVKAIGIAARKAIEQELGSRVHLELTVRVRRHWRTDERLLDRLGIE